MSFDTCLSRAVHELIAARAALDSEIRSYPTPVSGCDAQYNYLIGQRASVSEALHALSGPQFVATPRMPEPGTRVESR